MLRRSREEAQQGKADAARWEYQNRLDRSAGHFFRTLYEPDKELIKQMGAAALDRMSPVRYQSRRPCSLGCSPIPAIHTSGVVRPMLSLEALG